MGFPSSELNETDDSFLHFEVLFVLRNDAHDLDRSEECNTEEEFTCQSIHQCIPKERYHDGWPDCDDGSDEECGRGQHRCACGLPHCVDRHKVKDGVKDCEDGSDEEDIQNKTKKCPDESRLQDLLAVEKRRRKRQILYALIRIDSALCAHLGLQLMLCTAISRLANVCKFVSFLLRLPQKD
ncbi:uncharacterized protein TNIN_388191 [Trichonephila inaurata madagascariensis]|uniref:Uncharacterized protein n=1 Tax=Trichonephila inaurata madagascariensis TaxID=2747483 RepID=A0A8X7CE89_9ARAC|nr:uncharacterized protein TNIN_388191 [Trichonephila inaurata madagascariensis]